MFKNTFNEFVPDKHRSDNWDTIFVPIDCWRVLFISKYSFSKRFESGNASTKVAMDCRCLLTAGSSCKFYVIYLCMKFEFQTFTMILYADYLREITQLAYVSVYISTTLMFWFCALSSFMFWFCVHQKEVSKFAAAKLINSFHWDYLSKLFIRSVPSISKIFKG